MTDSLQSLSAPIPERIADVAQLEELLSRPSEAAIDALQAVPGDIMILGVGGKMGPTLARLARRAATMADGSPTKRKVIGVARFSDPTLVSNLESCGVETIRCDLLDTKSLAQLPAAPNLIYMAARKFGSTGDEGLTWGMNCVLPTMVCQTFPTSRIVAFSTGNVYSFTTPASGGSRESTPLNPVGEYGMSALGRERIFDYFSRSHGMRIAIVRLNYAHDLRYGVMVDLAQKVKAGQPIPVAMGYFNAIWQGDANAMTVAALAKANSPQEVFNVSGPRVLPVREICTQLAKRMKCEVTFEGVEAPTALLSNGAHGIASLGSPRVDEGQLLNWVADWVTRGGATLDRPTHFEVRDGKF
jgi:nucleoside-diphosphate-sugar epimerase